MTGSADGRAVRKVLYAQAVLVGGIKDRADGTGDDLHVATSIKIAIEKDLETFFGPDLLVCTLS